MNDHEDEIRRARQDRDAALKKIRDAKAGKMNSGFEAQYGEAYQRLVRLGDAPQIRLKYRG